MVPTSWSYGTFHQNNPVYINLIKAAPSQPEKEPTTHVSNNFIILKIRTRSNLDSAHKLQSPPQKQQMKNTFVHSKPKNLCNNNKIQLKLKLYAARDSIKSNHNHQKELKYLELSQKQVIITNALFSMSTRILTQNRRQLKSSCHNRLSTLSTKL